MILYDEVIGRVERIARRGNGLGWYAESHALKNTLLNELWDGEAFSCRGAISGRRFKAGGLWLCSDNARQTPIPTILSGSLSGLSSAKSAFSVRGACIEDMLCAHYDAHVPGCGSVEALPQQLVVGGLIDAGRIGAAVKIAERALAFADGKRGRRVRAAGRPRPVEKKARRRL
jgi:hypothetical protein